MPKSKLSAIIVIATSALRVGGLPAQTAPYHVNLLGFSDGRTTIQVENPTGLNRWGQVIGTYGGGSSGGTHAVLWTPNSANDGSGAGTLFSLETSAGFPPGTVGTTPTGMNDRGQVAGLAYTPGSGDGNQNQSWMWRPANLNGLKGAFHCCAGQAVTFPQVNIAGFGAAAEYADQMNNGGTIVAYGINGHPLLWTPNTANGLMGSWSAEPNISAPPTGINDAGQFTGGSCAGGNWNGPYLHSGALPLHPSDPISSPLWLPPGTQECVGGAGGLNQRGHLAVSAVSSNLSGIFAYLYKNGGAIDISTGAPSNALAINNYDQVVGIATTDTNRATLFEQGRAIDLNSVNDSVGYPLFSRALAINDSGQILCTGGGATVLLTPNALVITPVNITEGGFTHSGSTYTQTVTVTNAGTAALPRPISIVLDGLTSEVSLTNAAGISAYAGAGSSYANVSATDLAAGGITAPFALVFKNPGHLAITYKARVLAGPAPR